MLNEQQKQKLINKKICGQYLIKKWYKDGGLSSIFNASDLKNPHNDILIKVVKIDLINNDNKFFDELKIYKNIAYNNTNIVKIFDYSIDDEYFYIVLENLKGITLDEFIKKNKVLSWSEIKYIITQTINAIKSLHLNPNGQIIHRDIKPQNIIINNDFKIKLIDFGISTLQNEDKIITQENDLFCSPFYSSVDILELTPDVRRLQTKEQIDRFNEIVCPQLDIHAIAIIMYELITNKLPFDEMYNNSISQRNKMNLWKTRNIPKISNIRTDIPIDVDNVLARATASTPERKKIRYSNILEFEEDILRIELNDKNKRVLPKEILEKDNTLNYKVLKNKKIMIVVSSIIFVFILLIIIIVIYASSKR